jgi:hypothetical protein
MSKVQQFRFIALLGHGRERFDETALDQEHPTEPVVIDAYGFSDVYRYSGVVFLSENWFDKYSKDWQKDTSKIDELLVNLIKYQAKDSSSENLEKIKAYLASPPESAAESVEIWKSFYDPGLKQI